MSSKWPSPCCCFLIFFVCVISIIAIVAGIVCGVYFGVIAKDENDSDWERFFYTEAAVASDHEKCSKIGRDILQIAGGSAVDAAIATAICVEVINPHITGMGGGGLMLVYKRSSGQLPRALDFREASPNSVTETEPNEKGANSIAVPGQLKGFITAHREYGLLPWRDLLQPAIDLAENGIIIDQYLADIIARFETRFCDSPSLREILEKPSSSSDCSLKGKGDILRRPRFVEFLKKIQVFTFEELDNFFYNGGSGTQDIVNELNSYGTANRFSTSDFSSYTVTTRDAVQSDFDGLEVYSAPAPGSGAILAFWLNIMEKHRKRQGNLNKNADTFFKLMEGAKISSAYQTQLGDPMGLRRAFIDKVQEYVANPSTAQDAIDLCFRTETNETVDYYLHCLPNVINGMTLPVMLNDFRDMGTSHVSVLASNGDAVSMTTSLNYFFGSLNRSRQFGFIYNNQMFDFINGPDSFNAAPNSIGSRKRPFSSMSPTILIKDGTVRMVIGASGGKRIPSSIIQVIIGQLMFGLSLPKAVSMKRFHITIKDQMYKVNFEPGFPNSFITDLFNNHGYQMTEMDDMVAMSTVQVIYKEETATCIEAYSDLRKVGGKPAGYELGD